MVAIGQEGGFLATHRDIVHAGWEVDASPSQSLFPMRSNICILCQVQALIERSGLVSDILLVLFHPLAVHSLYDDPRDHVTEAKVNPQFIA